MKNISEKMNPHILCYVCALCVFWTTDNSSLFYWKSNHGLCPVREINRRLAILLLPRA